MLLHILNEEQVKGNKEEAVPGAGEWAALSSRALAGIRSEPRGPAELRPFLETPGPLRERGRGRPVTGAEAAR